MYTNITLAGPDLSAVEELLRRADRTAYVLVRPGFWVVYDTRPPSNRTERSKFWRVKLPRASGARP